MTYGQDYGQPGQYPQSGYGQQYPQEPPWQPQPYDPQAHQQHISAPQQAYSPQGQPWPQPGYGQPPFPPQQPGYQPPQPPQGRRRKRHTARNVIIGIGALVVVIIAVSVANSGGHTVNTTGSSGSSTSDGSAASKKQTAGIGSSIPLSGNSSGEQMSVAVTKVIAKASPGDEFSSAPAGHRLYAVQFRLRDTGSAAYSDAPDNSAVVVDSGGQSYQSSIDNAAECTSFPGTENIAPGSSGLGCVIFEVPEKAKIVSVQFTLDSGMGPQTGQWNVG